MQERQSHGHKSHLPDRGVAEQTLRFGLREADQVGEDEGRGAEDGYDLGVVLEERKQIVKGKKTPADTPVAMRDATLLGAVS